MGHIWIANGPLGLISGGIWYGLQLCIRFTYFIHMYTHVHVQVRGAQTCVHTYIYIYMHTYIYIYTHTYTYMLIHMHRISMYVKTV